MKRLYTTPDLELFTLKLTDVVLASTESSIPSDINSGGGTGSQFDDDLEP